MGFLFSKTVRNVMLLVLLFFAVQYCLRIKSYTIPAKDFRTIAARAIATNADSSVSSLMSNLRSRYGPHLIADAEQQWLAVSAGGMQLRMKFLMASLTEYLAVIASPFRTSGRSGFHWANSTCTVLNGAVSRYADVANYVNKESFRPGDNFRQSEFQSAIFELSDETHLVCYGRGLLPLSGLWLNSGAVTNFDPGALLKQIFVYSNASVRNVYTWIQETFAYYKEKALRGRSEL